MFFADSYIDPGTELILGVEGKVVDVFVMPWSQIEEWR
jgi:hypothetical protein